MVEVRAVGSVVGWVRHRVIFMKEDNLTHAP